MLIKSYHIISYYINSYTPISCSLIGSLVDMQSVLKMSTALAYCAQTAGCFWCVITRVNVTLTDPFFFTGLRCYANIIIYHIILYHIIHSNFMFSDWLFSKYAECTENVCCTLRTALRLCGVLLVHDHVNVTLTDPFFSLGKVITC